MFGCVYSPMLSYAAGSSQDLTGLVINSPGLTAALRPRCPLPTSCGPLASHLPAGEFSGPLRFTAAPCSGEPTRTSLAVMYDEPT